MNRTVELMTLGDFYDVCVIFSFVGLVAVAIAVVIARWPEWVENWRARRVYHRQLAAFAWRVHEVSAHRRCGTVQNPVPCHPRRRTVG